MQEGAARTVIVPPAYMVLGSHDPHPLADIIQPDRAYVMDVTLTKLVQQ